MLEDTLRKTAAQVVGTANAERDKKLQDQWERIEELVNQMARDDCITAPLVQEYLDSEDDAEFDVGLLLLSSTETDSMLPLVEQCYREHVGTWRGKALLWRLSQQPKLAYLPLFERHIHDPDIILRSVATFGVHACAGPEKAIPLLRQSAARGHELHVLAGRYATAIHSSSSVVYYLSKYGNKGEDVLLGLLREDVKPSVEREILRTFLEAENPATLEYARRRISAPTDSDGLWQAAAETVFRFGQEAEKRALVRNTPSLTPPRQRFLARLAKLAGDDYGFDLCVLAARDDRLAANVSVLWQDDPTFFGRLIASRFQLSGYDSFGFEAFKEWYQSIAEKANGSGANGQE